MLDPLPVPPFLRDAVQPLADSLHLKTLPLHIHEVLIAFVFYNLIDGVVSPYFSALLMGKTYREFPPRTRLQWNMHVTSTINAVILSSGAIYVLLHDNDRLNDTWEERLFGYTGLSGLVQAISAGYFFWDLTVSTANVKYLGAPDLIHAIVALTIAVLGFVSIDHAVRQVPANDDEASFWSLLWHTICLARTLYTICQQSLVLQQDWHGRHDSPEDQWAASHGKLLHLSSHLWHLAYSPLLPRRLDGGQCHATKLDCL